MVTVWLGISLDIKWVGGWHGRWRTHRFSFLALAVRFPLVTYFITPSTELDGTIQFRA